MRRRLGGLLVIGALVLLAAPAGATEPPLGPIPVNPTVDDLVFRGSDAAHVDQLHWEVRLAEDLAIRACMRRKGYDFRLWPSLPRWAYGGNPDGRLFGVLDLDDAARYGYHRAPNPELDEAIRRRLSFRQPEQSARFFFRDEMRCLRSTGEWLGTNAHWALFDVWQSIRYGDTDSDSRAIAAEAAWSECMAGAGHGYDAWWDANNDDRWATRRATEQEKAVAVADVTCRNETNLTGTLYAVEVAYYEQAMASRPDLLDGLEAATDHVLEVVRRVIARHYPHMTPR